MSFEQLGEPEEVAETRTRGQLSRLLLALLGIGVALGLIFGLGSWLFGTFSQTEPGLCRVTIAPCTSLSLSSVEQLSGVDLPDGTEVVSGYSQELGTLHEFRAQVVLPKGGIVTMSDAYDESGDLADLPAAARDLRDATTWGRPLRDAEGFSVAVTGTRDGRTVVVFDEKYTPAS